MCTNVQMWQNMDHVFNSFAPCVTRCMWTFAGWLFGYNFAHKETTSSWPVCSFQFFARVRSGDGVGLWCPWVRYVFLHARTAKINKTNPFWAQRVVRVIWTGRQEEEGGRQFWIMVQICNKMHRTERLSWLHGSHEDKSPGPLSVEDATASNRYLATTSSKTHAYLHRMITHM